MTDLLNRFSIARNIPMQMLVDRGIKQTSITEYDNETKSEIKSEVIAVPFLDCNGKHPYFQYRYQDGSTERFKFEQGARPTFYGLDVLHKASNDYVVMVEGVTDWLTLNKFNIPTLALPSASYSKHLDKHDELDRFNKIYLCVEPDKAGEKCRQDASSSKFANKIVPIFFTEEHKDVSDLFVNLEDPDEEFSQVWSQLIQEADKQNSVSEAVVEEKSSGGKVVDFIEPERWHEKVHGRDLLREISETLSTYITFEYDYVADVVATWVLGTHLFEGFSTFPFINIKSAEMGCGKSTLMRVMDKIVRKGRYVVFPTPATMFRQIDKYQPTYLIDEADRTISNQKQELIGILNCAHSEGLFVERLEPSKDGGYDTRAYQVFTPLVMAGISKLPDTISNRCIEVFLRKQVTEKKRIVWDTDKMKFEILKRKAIRWGEDNISKFKIYNLDENRIQSLINRDRDNWSALIRIADIIDAEFSAKMCETAIEMVANKQIEYQRPSGEMLEDLFNYFEAHNADRVTTEDFIPYLHGLEDRSWNNYGRSHKEIKPAQVSRLLSEYKIYPKTIRTSGTRTLKGYLRKDCETSFISSLHKPSQRHSLDKLPTSSVTNGVTQTTHDVTNSAVTNSADVTGNGTQILSGYGVTFNNREEQKNYDQRVFKFCCDGESTDEAHRLANVAMKEDREREALLNHKFV